MKKATFTRIKFLKNNWLWQALLVAASLLVFCSPSFSQACDPNSIDKCELGKNSALQATWHGQIVKTPVGYSLAGQNLASNGSSNQLNLTAIPSAGYTMPANVFPVWGAIGGRTQVAFLGSDGIIYAVGDEGSLIDGGRTSSTAWGATTLPLPSGVTACDVAKWEGTASDGGAGFLVFMTYGGALYITGPDATTVRAGATSNIFNTVTLPGGVTAVDFAVGYRTLLILGSNGSLYASGDQMYRGNGTASINQTTPLLLITQPPLSAGGILQIEAGRSSYYVLDADGTIHVLGENSDGQLGENTTTDQTSWKKVGQGCAGGNLSTVVYISAVGTHDENSKSASAILANGTLRSWGDNDQFAIGGPSDGTIYSCPLVPAGSGSNVIAVASGGHITPYMNSNSPTEVCNVGHNADGGLATELRTIGVLMSAIQLEAMFVTLSRLWIFR